MMPKGFHHSKETRLKMSNAKKGCKRKPFSKEWRKKLSEAVKGRRRYFSKEHRQKLSEAKKGSHRSEETRCKLSKAMKGQKNPNWKGGIIAENERIRRSIELRLWREAVFARDNWTCQECGTREELHVHHTKSFAKHLELRTSIENGITLCKKCHNMKHHKEKKCQKLSL